MINAKKWNAPSEVCFHGGTVLNVYSGELLKANVLLKGERFYYVGPSIDLIRASTETIDVSGKLLVPGYIDPHFHPWFIYNPLSFGQEALKTGITTLFCDNLLFYMILGPNLFERFIDILSQMPIKYFWFCRVVPQTPMCDEDELFGIGNIKRLLSNPLIQAIGEITRWTDIIEGNRKIKDLISFAKRLKKRVDGHTAGAKYKQLALLSEAGIESCHEAITAKEALERLRLGMYVILRESSLRQDLKELLRIVTENRVLTDRLMLTTDCSSPAFYDDFGIMDNILKIAIDMGIDPILVYRMVTINPAVYFGMDHEIGGIAPGRFADMVILTDIKDPRPEMVISKGRIIVKNGKLIDSFPIMDWNQFFTQLSFKKNNWRLDSRMLEIKTKGKLISFPVISLVKTVITRIEWKELKVKDGFIHLPESPKYSFICLINKEGRWISKGIIKGFGNLQGFASSFNTASQILVIGRNPDAMAKAVNRVLEINGGIVAIEDGSIVYELPLPLGGIMSDRSIVELASKERELKNFLVNRGYPFHDPFYTLVFLPNDFLPEVRINYEGDCEHKNPGSFMAQMRSKYMRLSF